MRLFGIALVLCLVAGRYLELQTCPFEFFIFSQRRRSDVAELRYSGDGEHFTTPCWNKLFAYVATAELSRYVEKNYDIYLAVTHTIIDPIPAELCTMIPHLHTVILSYSADLLPFSFNAECKHLEYVHLNTNRNAPIVVHTNAIVSTPLLQRMYACSSSLTLLARLKLYMQM